MAREPLARTFEPFFTTKSAGGGTGLGLATVYGIVTQTGGHVSASSEPGRGTAIEVYLPRVWDAVAAPEANRPDAGAAAGETILLVEDEEIVRTLVQEMLEAEGYRVLSADNGACALDLARAHAGQIDLLVTDIVMPGLSGQELAARVLAERPAVRVLFTSGYTEDAISNHGVLSPGSAFLEKPFTAVDLAQKLRGLLEPRLVA